MIGEFNNLFYLKKNKILTFLIYVNNINNKALKIAQINKYLKFGA